MHHIKSHQLLVLEEAIQLCKNRSASHTIGLVASATADDCVDLLTGLRTRLLAQPSTEVPDLWAHVDRTNAEAEAARVSMRIAIAHAERVAHQHARLLEALEDSLTLLCGTAYARQQLCQKHEAEGPYLPAMLQLRETLAGQWASLIGECRSMPADEPAEASAAPMNPAPVFQSAAGRTVFPSTSSAVPA